jgi:hypothetical protein
MLKICIDYLGFGPFPTHSGLRFPYFGLISNHLGSLSSLFRSILPLADLVSLKRKEQSSIKDKIPNYSINFFGS